jgi:tetratricopeptide (TPR) repeat protein
VLAQADGVPLYAIETVRMLLDRGLLVQDGPRYVPTGDVSELDVPETLQALAAARLDGLSVTERAMLQDAAVLGQSFSAAGLAALGQRSAPEIEQTVSTLVVKQLIAPDDDPLSPEPDQYHFLQGLIRATAYATLSRRDRKARHLAAARHLQEMSEDGASELAEVLAAHFLEAAAADPDASDAPRIRAAACETLEDAGRRALSLALGAEAMRAFDRAAELAQDDLARARLLDQAGQAALLNDDLDETGGRLTEAIAIFDTLGEHEAAGRVKVDYARLLHRQDRDRDAIRMLHEALPDLGADTEVRAAALAELAYRHAFAGEYEQSLAAADACLAIAETRQLWRTIIRAFDARAFVRAHQGQLEEARAFRERALAIGLAHDVTREILPVFNNVADLALQDDRYREALDYAERGHRSARALGDRRLEADSAVMILAARMPLGIWDEPDPPGVAGAGLLAGALLLIRARTRAARGATDALRALLTEAEALPQLSQNEYAAAAGIARAIALRALGDHRAALELALPVALAPDTINEDRREALVEAGLAARELGQEDAVTQLIAVVEQLPPASRSPVLRSGAARLAGLLALRAGDHATADERLFAAVRALDGIEAPFVLAQVLLERAELRLALGRRTDAAPLATEASSIFERLRATPWVQRARALPVALVSA